jgi:hypothetical protein
MQLIYIIFKNYLLPASLLLYYQHRPLAVPWLRRLVAGLSPWRPGFDPGSVHVGFVVDKVALGQVFPRQFHSTGAQLHGKTKKLIIFITHTREALIYFITDCEL